MSKLARHVPRLALEWAEQYPDQHFRQIDGTLCFADISGFTALAEQLAQRGRQGGEELVETLGRVFSEMLDIARARGGTLLKFGGDALLLFFQGPDHALQATSAAVEMREALRKAAEIPTSVGPLRLSMSVGLHSGPADFFLVGSRHRELVLLGAAADAVVAAEGAASARQIVVSAATATLLPHSATQPRDDGQLLLRWRKAPVPPADAVVAREWPAELVASLVPDALVGHLASGAPDPEHRVACIAFIRFSGTDAILADQGPAVLARILDQTVGGVQDILTEEGVTLLAVDLDHDGGKFFLASGIPRSHEDDEGVMLRALRRIMDAQLPLQLQAGVSRGHVFAVEVGGMQRAAFSAMGDTTNTAARIAAQTPPGSIYVHPEVLDECLIRFEVEQAGPLKMKGKALPQLVYAIGAELGMRQREGLDVEVFIGRAAALETIRKATQGMTDSAGQVISLVGGIGVGKSRLLSEVLGGFAESAVMVLRAEPYGSNNPYRMFRDAMRQAVGVSSGTEEAMQSELRQSVERIDPALLPWLALIGDVLQVPVEPSPVVRDLAEEFRPARTADVVVQLLEAIHPNSLVIAVDDAHWCDEASTVLLARLERACQAHRWLMIAVRRDGDSGYVPSSGIEIQLEPLEPEAIRQLVYVATEAAPLRPHVVDTIVERAAGYPLFAIELLRALRDIGSVEALPESIEAALAVQIDALDQTARRILRFSSVLGQSFSADILAKILDYEGYPFDPELIERLQRFLQQDQPGRYQFRSSLLRDTIYEGLSYRLRHRLHRAAGLALEQRTPDPDAIAHDLALHFFRGEEPERALHFGMEAGRRSKAAYANAEAAKNFEIALAATRRSACAVDQVVEIWRELGVTRLRAGLVDAAIEAYRRALKLVRDEPLQRADLLCDLAWAQQRAGRLNAALRSVLRGIRLAQSKDSVQSRTILAKLQSLQSTIYFVQDRPSKARIAAQAAIPVARDTGEKEALVRALNIVETANLVMTGKTEGDHLREAFEIADQLGDRRLQAMLAGTLSGLHYYENRWNDAVAGYREAHKLYAQAGNYLDGAYMLVNLGEILSRQGRLIEARESLSEALRVTRAADFIEGIANSEMELARVALLEGDIKEALRLAETAKIEFVRLNEKHFVLRAELIKAEALLRQDHAAQALEVIDLAVEVAGAEAADLPTNIAAIRARVLLALGRYEDAENEISGGLKAAEDQNLLYDQAMFLKLRNEFNRTLNSAINDDELARVSRILGQLGAVD